MLFVQVLPSSSSSQSSRLASQGLRLQAPSTGRPAESGAPMAATRASSLSRRTSTASLSSIASGSLPAPVTVRNCFFHLMLRPRL